MLGGGSKGEWTREGKNEDDIEDMLSYGDRGG